MSPLAPGSRTVLITGGAGGMGTAIASRFARAGDLAITADLNDADITVDVRSPASCAAMVDEAIARRGAIDVLITAAGVWVEGPSATMTEDQWDRTIDVNLKGTFFAIRYAIEPLIAAEGCVVAISSDYGLVGGPEAAVYCASKFGVNGLVRSLALELAPHGVRVNSLCPGDVDTPMLTGQARDYGGEDPDGYLSVLRSHLPQGERGRFVRVDEIAEAVWYLASTEAAPLNGVCLPFEWGVTAGY